MNCYYYHLVMVVKCRRKVIDDQISDRAQPKSEISKFINAYKSVSSRLLKKEYPWLKKVDSHHKLSFRPAEEYDAVAVEDADLKAMSQAQNFGKCVMDNGYGTFLNMLSYKLEQRGKVLVKTDRFYHCSCEKKDARIRAISKKEPPDRRG